MLKAYIAVGILIVAIVNMHAVTAQHCPPIVESYLESVSVKHIDEGISIAIDYKKSGGQPKEAYQAYIVAYSQAARLPEGEYSIQINGNRPSA